MGYEKRIVAFIDILGFGNFVEQSEKSEEKFQIITETLTGLTDFFKKENLDSNQILQVSDSTIISRLLSDKGGVHKMLNDCADAIHLLISYGFLCRGAIKIGNLIHKESLIFGNAFIEAYRAEGPEPLPIVKFDEGLIKCIKDFPAEQNETIEDWEIQFVLKNCSKKSNGEYYLDYFKDLENRIGYAPEFGFKHYSKLREIITEGLKLPNESSPFKKYLWAAEQFNKITINLYPLEKIKI